MSGHSLEDERQAILDRMQARRERYRRMLISGVDLDEAVIVEPRVTAAYPARQAIAHDAARAGPRRATYTTAYGTAPVTARHGPVVRALMEHPFLVALGVAAIVAIGPRRILRTAASSGTALSSVAARNQDNLDLVGRLLTMAGSYVQGRMK